MREGGWGAPFVGSLKTLNATTKGNNTPTYYVLQKHHQIRLEMKRSIESYLSDEYA
jgi:hypothetical protein